LLDLSIVSYLAIWRVKFALRVPDNKVLAHLSGDLLLQVRHGSYNVSQVIYDGIKAFFSIFLPGHSGVSMSSRLFVSGNPGTKEHSLSFVFPGDADIPGGQGQMTGTDNGFFQMNLLGLYDQRIY
jgi:hypothetical protein